MPCGPVPVKTLQLMHETTPVVVDHTLLSSLWQNILSKKLDNILEFFLGNFNVLIAPRESLFWLTRISRLINNYLIKAEGSTSSTSFYVYLSFSYLVNISFYLALKASRDNMKGHPIFDKLVKHREVGDLVVDLVIRA